MMTQRGTITEPTMTGTPPRGGGCGDHQREGNSASDGNGNGNGDRRIQPSGEETTQDGENAIAADRSVQPTDSSWTAAQPSSPQTPSSYTSSSWSPRRPPGADQTSTLTPPVSSTSSSCSSPGRIRASSASPSGRQRPRVPPPPKSAGYNPKNNNNGNNKKQHHRHLSAGVSDMARAELLHMMHQQQGDTNGGGTNTTHHSHVPLRRSKSALPSSLPSPSSQSAQQTQPHLSSSFPPACRRWLRDLPGNGSCLDCGVTNSPEWACVLYGALVCIRCSGHHRGLGVGVSTVRSITMDHWSYRDVVKMLEGGNSQLDTFFARHKLTHNSYVDPTNGGGTTAGGTTGVGSGPGTVGATANPHGSLPSSTSTSTSTSSNSSSPLNLTNLATMRYKTKAALFYRQQLDRHVTELLQNGPYQGRQRGGGGGSNGGSNGNKKDNVSDDGDDKPSKDPVDSDNRAAGS